MPVVEEVGEDEELCRAPDAPEHEAHSHIAGAVEERGGAEEGTLHVFDLAKHSPDGLYPGQVANEERCVH